MTKNAIYHYQTATTLTQQKQQQRQQQKQEQQRHRNQRQQVESQSNEIQTFSLCFVTKLSEKTKTKKATVERSLHQDTLGSFYKAFTNTTNGFT